MPAGLKEAYRSPFHSSGPYSQMFDLSSYTRSVDTGSLRNEAYVVNYDLQNPLPKYAPSGQIPRQLEKKISETIDPPKLDDSPEVDRTQKDRTQKDRTQKDPSKLEQAEPSEDTECDRLIERVLSNPKCRQTLMRLLNPGMTEGFSLNLSHNYETYRTVIVYILGGILFLALLELFVKIGKMLVKV